MQNNHKYTTLNKNRYMELVCREKCRVRASTLITDLVIVMALPIRNNNTGKLNFDFLNC